MEGWDSQSPSDLSSSSKTEFKKSKHDSKDNAMEKLRDLESEEKVIVSTSEDAKDENIWKSLMESFNASKVPARDSMIAEEMLRDVKFDKYNEKSSCKVIRGIPQDNFKSVFQKIASRHHIPEKQTASILDVQNADNAKVITPTEEFKFTAGDNGRVFYGKTLTRKHKGGVDLAYAFFSLEFKLSAVEIEEERPRPPLMSFGTRKNIVRLEERNLSKEEKKHFLNFFQAKAIKEFRKENP